MRRAVLPGLLWAGLACVALASPAQAQDKPKTVSIKERLEQMRKAALARADAGAAASDAGAAKTDAGAAAADAGAASGGGGASGTATDAGAAKVDGGAATDAGAAATDAGASDAGGPAADGGRTDGGVAETDRVQVTGMDTAELRRTRPTRKKETAERMRRRWGELLGRPQASEELKTHARRIAYLQRIRTLADAAKKNKLVEQVDELITEEDRRHGNAMNALRGAAQ